VANKYIASSLNINNIIEMYESGYTQQSIANYYGTTQKVIWSRLKKASHKCRVPKNLKQNGKDNASWKGNEAGYKAFHYRLYSVRGKPDYCSMCERTEAKRFEWANMTGTYEDIYDYVRLCSSCHAKFDNKVRHLKGGIKRCR
jgi:predicted Fe-S protein YdhL (DUF1289 family)